MIVKNSEKTLETALRSVQQICSSIIILDTGSDDSSMRIARRLGAEVHFHLWENNFAHARNLCLNFVRTPWILALDADEEVIIENLAHNQTQCQQFITDLQDPKAGGLTVSITNILADGSHSSAHTYTRLFRNDKRIRYTGAIHEQIAPSIQALGLDIRPSSLEILHSGYADNSPEKIERNSVLLRQELAESPHDGFLLYHLGQTEFSAGHLSEAETYLTKALAQETLSLSQREMALLRLAQISLAHNHFTQVLDHTQLPCSNTDYEGLRRFIRATALTFLKKFSAAREELSDISVQESRLVSLSALGELKNLLRDVV